MCAEGRLGDVMGVHSHLLRRAQIELDEEASAMKLVKQLVYYRDQELVVGSSCTNPDTHKNS